MLRSQVGGIGANLRQHFVLRDAVGHVPVGTQNHVAHVPLKYRSLGLRIGPSDDYVHLQDVGNAILGGAEGEQSELRNVDDDGRCLKWREPAPALESERNLSDSLCRRSLQCSKGRLSEKPIDAEPMTGLIVAHPKT